MTVKKSTRKYKVKLDGATFHVDAPYDTALWQSEVREKAKEELLTEKEYRLNDIKWKLQNREGIKRFLMWLLVCQNVAVFGILIGSLYFNKMGGLQAVFATLIGGTLIETASAIYIITKWLFSDILYEKDNIK